MKPWRRDASDKVTPEMHAYILDRDVTCIAAKVDLSHQCRTRFGTPHRSDDRKRLTLDHVHHAATTGKRATSDPRHLLAACGWANNEGWCSSHRAEEREYLARVEAPQ
jgi:hypothetical protein